jgi:hypothetical protein
LAIAAERLGELQSFHRIKKLARRLQSAQRVTNASHRDQRMHHSMHDYRDNRSGRAGFERIAGRALDYLSSRTADHWLMFAAGLVIGLVVG